MKPKLIKILEALIIPGLIFILWLVASKQSWVHPYLLPPPQKVFSAFQKLLVSGELLKHLGHSFLRVLAGFGLTLSLAVPLAFLMYSFEKLKNLLKPSLEFLRSIPPLATIPLLILWLGLGEASKIAVIVMASFFPVFMNLLSGLNTVDAPWKELSKSLEFKRKDYVLHILFPAALPSLLTGIQLGLSYAWRALMGAEMIAAASGLGYLILDAEEMGRIDKVFVGIFTLGLCGVLLDQGLMRLFKRLTPWEDTKGAA